MSVLIGVYQPKQICIKFLYVYISKSDSVPNPMING